MTPPPTSHDPALCGTQPFWLRPWLVFCVVICNLSAGMWKFVIVLMFVAQIATVTQPRKGAGPAKKYK